MKTFIKYFWVNILIFFISLTADGYCSTQKIKFIGFDVHDVLIHLNPANIHSNQAEKTKYLQNICLSVAQQLKSEYKINQNQAEKIAQHVGFIMKNSMPKIIPLLVSWVSAAAEQSELGKNWFTRKIVLEKEIIDLSEQILKSECYNTFISQTLDSTITDGIAELAIELKQDTASIKKSLCNILKNGMINNIAKTVVTKFFDNKACAQLAELIRPMDKLVQILKAKGFTIFIISNAANDVVRGHYSKKPELSELFETFEDKNIFVSGELGLKKPDIKIFEYAAAKVGFKYSECIFVDDEIPNIEAANQLGITGIHFNRENINKFLDQLEQLAIITKAERKAIL